MSMGARKSQSRPPRLAGYQSGDDSGRAAVPTAAAMPNLHRRASADIAAPALVYEAADFARIQAMIFVRAGIHLHDGKRAMAFNRLSRRLRACGVARFSDYLNRLDGDAQAPEWEWFVNALTTNLTSFFREAHHFELLHELLRNGNRSGNRSGNRKPEAPWSIWSCATASGEEAYSIAITVDQALAEAAQRVCITASDINTQTLSVARRGEYPLARVHNLDEQVLKRYFQRGTGCQQGLVRVQPWLAQRVAFARVNLQDVRWPAQLAGLDIVFCRNVLIYFSDATQRRVLEHLHGVLRPGGHLFMGHAEHLSRHEDLFRPLARTVYVRVG